MFNVMTPEPLLEWRIVLQLSLGLLLLALVATTLLVNFSPRGQFAFARAFTKRSLRTSVMVATILVSTLPALTMAILLAERAANLRTQQIETRLADTAGAAALAIDSFLDKHLAGVTSAAEAISSDGSSTQPALSTWLTLYHSIYGDFLTMLATDGDGNIVTATSLINGAPAPIHELTAQNVSDRSYFHEPMRTNTPFISHVFRGRGFGSDPIVAVSAPMHTAKGSPRGVVEGSLNLRVFAQIESDLPSVEHAIMLILDERSRVIYAGSGAAVEILQPAVDVPGLGALLSAEPNAGDVVKSSDAFGAVAETANGWQVLYVVPTTIIHQQTSADYTLAAILVGGAILLALAMAAALARRVGRAMGTLNQSVAAFSLDGDGGNFEIPQGTPSEFHPVIEHMKQRSLHIRKTHERLKNSIAAGDALGRKLTRAITEKESEIDERTRDLKESNDRLHNLSRRDALTGIANRRHFEAFEERMRRMCRRDDQPMTIIMIDIDLFKKYNDSYGHDQGDTCLRKVAESLESCAQRPLDLVARFGGEEFIVVLGSSSVSDGCIVAERMRRAVRDLGIPHPSSTHDVVTISVGVGGGKFVEPIEPNLFRRQADTALYAAKAGGRDCVYIASEESASPYEFMPTADDRKVSHIRII